MPAALESLQRAVGLAEPEGYVRIFVDEGAPMGSLLRALASQGPAGRYSRQILAISTPPTHAGPSNHPFPAHLTEPDRAFLHLLGPALSGPELPRDLAVSRT